MRHTCFPFGERYMTSRFILDEFDLDLSSTGLLVRFGLFLLIVLVAATLDGVLVVDEGVFSHGRGTGLGMEGLGVWRGGCAWVHVEGALALAHGRRGNRGRFGIL